MGGHAVRLRLPPAFALTPLRNIPRNGKEKVDTPGHRPLYEKHRSPSGQIIERGIAQFRFVP
jgi:hypothetical protein